MIQDAVKHAFVCGMSRSGTTLLTTILDSHPRISMGYELLPAGLPPAAEMDQLLVSAISDSGGDPARCAEMLLARGHPTLATFVKRCARALVTPEDLSAICREFLADGQHNFDGIEMRTRLSLAVADAKMRKEGTHISGFKINAPSIEAFNDVIPDGRFVYIARDPRDVVASHFANDFNRTIEHITRAWMQYTTRFRAFADKHGGQACLIRYEDLVRDPERVIRLVLDLIGVEFNADVLRFFDSKASVHQGGHINAQRLRRNISDTSVDRWQRELSIEQIHDVQKACVELMPELGYPLAPTDPLVGLGWVHRKAKRAAFSTKRRYYRDEYAKLLLPLRAGYTNLTWREAAAGEKAQGENILIIRHDVDHDYENALCIARWEHGQGLRATYCILHTAWYYGSLVNGRMTRSREVVELCRELQAMDHEVNLHNNVAVAALRHGFDAPTLLQDELLFLRSHGIEVAGTATHGDPLCRELDFRNYELFSEGVYESRGGPRTVEYEGNHVALGTVSMTSFGLEYEAYDIPRDIYITDSGGNLRLRRNTRGRGGKRRSDLDRTYPYGTILGILTHPVWWNFQRDAPPGRAVPELAAAAEIVAAADAAPCGRPQRDAV